MLTFFAILIFLNRSFPLWRRSIPVNDQGGQTTTVHTYEAIIVWKIVRCMSSIIKQFILQDRGSVPSRHGSLRQLNEVRQHQNAAFRLQERCRKRPLPETPGNKLNVEWGGRRRREIGEGIFPSPSLSINFFFLSPSLKPYFYPAVTIFGPPSLHLFWCPRTVGGVVFRP